MDLEKNPFNPGVPSEPDRVVGRERIISDIEGAVFNTERQAVVSITGSRRIGKSSLLNKLKKHWSSERGDVICALLDCSPFAGDSPHSWYRATLEEVGVSADDEPTPESFRNELSRRVAETKKHIILLLDEFETLAGDDSAPRFDAVFFRELRTLLVRPLPAGRLTLITATRQGLAEYPWAPGVPGSPFDNITGRVERLRMLEPDKAIELLEFGKFLTSAERSLLLRIAGPHPHFLHVAGSTAWHLKREKLLEAEKGQLAEGDLDLAGKLEPEFRRSYRVQAESVYSKILRGLGKRAREDLLIRALTGAGDFRFEPKLRRNDLLDRKGAPYSEGLRAYCLSDSLGLSDAVEARFRRLPSEVADTLRAASVSGDVVEGFAQEALRRRGWLDEDGTVRPGIRPWIPLAEES